MESKNDKNLEQKEYKAYERKIKENRICKIIKSEKNIAENKILQNKILKIRIDQISLDELEQDKRKKISFCPFKVKFLFNYFFSSKKPFTFRFIQFGGASPGNNSFFSSLLFSSLLFSSLLFSSLLFSSLLCYTSKKRNKEKLW